MSFVDEDLLLTSFGQMVEHLSVWLDKAADHLSRLGRDPDLMFGWQLAPDMYPLAGQVRFACFLACEPRFRLQGLPLPAALLAVREEGWASNARPGTLAEAKVLLAQTVVSLAQGVWPSLAPNADRQISLALPDGHVFDLTAAKYLIEWAVPQFYFHINTAYAILRTNGVSLGKQDYAAHMSKYL
jgi:hypothetical protein